VVSLQSGGAVHFENVPALRTIGADFSVLARILPSLTADGLVLTFSGAYLDSTYTDYHNASGFDPTTGVYSNTNDFTGNRVVQTPRFTSNVGLSQTINIPGGPLEAGVDFYYNSGFYFLAQNTPNTKESSYKTLSLTLSYLYEPWNTRLTAFGRNILNEHYFAARFTNDFGTDDFPAQLSSYGLTFHWEF
jgi:iron complex outermembrane receptor protein